MSEISKELQDQQYKDVGAAIKKVFGDIPVIDAKAIDEEQRKQKQALIDRLNAQITGAKR